MTCPRTPISTFQARRRALLDTLETPALLCAGLPRPRQYRANTYPFRAKSHFLLLVGAHIPGAAVLLADGRTTLFVEPEQPGDALWEGPKPTMDALQREHGVDEVRAIGEVDVALEKLGGPVATLPTEDAASCAWLSARLKRAVEPSTGNDLSVAQDAALADAMITLRLCHDDAGLTQIRYAAEVTARAHAQGMRATKGAQSEVEVYGAMMGVLRSEGMQDSFGPIVSIHGEVLHNEDHSNALRPGDLLLADVGGETVEGWAGDVTRVWPVSGTFSPTQRTIYELVLEVERAAIDKVRAGTRYRDVHETAKRTMVAGLRSVGIFRGDVDGLLERGAAAVFFPHGVGHLLGLDVHDMEDLGDRAGYAPGRTRSTNFGDCYLRLDRDLVPRMTVTIEPGFYQVPAILQSEEYTGPLGDDLRRDVLERFSDVRGIRIEDDVLVTEGDPEVLTGGAPKDPLVVEAMVREGRS